MNGNQGYVYFIATRDDRAVKIGFASDVRKRRGELQIGSPQRLYIIYALPGTMDDERAIRDRFTHLRIAGEWLRFNEGIHDFLDDLEEAQIVAALRTVPNPAGEVVAFKSAMNASASRCLELLAERSKSVPLP